MNRPEKYAKWPKFDIWPHVIVPALIMCAIGNGVSAYRIRQAVILYDSGYEQIKSGNYGAAIRELERARTYKPDFVPVYRSLAIAYAKAGRIDDALVAMWKVIILAEDVVAQSYIEWGDLLAGAGRDKDALEMWNMVDSRLYPEVARDAALRIQALNGKQTANP